MRPVPRALLAPACPALPPRPIPGRTPQGGVGECREKGDAGARVEPRTGDPGLGASAVMCAALLV